MITCPKCGHSNRPGAKFCQNCRADLSPERELSFSTPAGPTDLLGKLKQLVGGAEPPAPKGAPVPGGVRPPHPAEVRERTAVLPVRADSQRLEPLQRGMVVSHARDLRRRYGIVAARELERSIYYDALDLTCAACGMSNEQPPLTGLCQHCQTPLAAVLIHERRSRASGLHSESEVQQLIQLSAAHEHVLSHRDIIQYGERTYTVTEHPGRWGVLVRGRRQRSPDEALAGVAQIGRAMVYLHEHGFAYSETGGLALESIVLTGGGTELLLADLNSCVPLPGNDADAVRAQVNRDITFLGSLLFYLATGMEIQRADINAVPPDLRPFVERAMQDHYATAGDMLDDFSYVPAAPARPLKPAFGQATHPGRRHTHNEDAVVTFTFNKQQDGGAVPVGFFLVADGMGGHDAGDVASQTVNQIVTDWIIKTKVLPDLEKTTRKLTAENVPGDLLAQAVQQANQVLFQHGQTTGSDLGSTVAAALVIGDLAMIAGVGDSRAYLLRGGRLEQITQDHSLVARLLDAGVIAAEDVRSHPQRNQIYRCLGHSEQVEVDTFAVPLRPADRLVLCSDGLWEMVLDADIRRIIEQARSPQQACDALIDAANRAGGEDNIGVIVVEME
ncbi:MAG: protein phosphatase 2C domain-containing protein [Anaerolineae bacterium]|nr:protein phosphatase 2C domain-containing protein [Anaerolineae bacterium]